MCRSSHTPCLHSRGWISAGPTAFVIAIVSLTIGCATQHNRDRAIEEARAIAPRIFAPAPTESMIVLRRDQFMLQ